MGSATRRIPQISVAQLRESGPVLDVRRNLNTRGSRSGAQHIPLHELPDRLSEVPIIRWRHLGAATARRLLQSSGARWTERPVNVTAYLAWVRAGFTVEPREEVEDRQSFCPLSRLRDPRPLLAFAPRDPRQQLSVRKSTFS